MTSPILPQDEDDGADEPVLAALRRNLRVLGEGGTVLLIVRDASGVRLWSDDSDPWGLIDSFACAEDDRDEPELLLGPGSRGRAIH